MGGKPRVVARVAKFNTDHSHPAVVSKSIYKVQFSFLLVDTK